MSEYSVFESAEGLSKKDFITPNKFCLTFDDVTMVPKFSNMASRDEVNLNHEIFDGYTCIPINSTCMSTVTGSKMLSKMVKMGCTGMLHRGCSPEEQKKMFYEALEDVCNSQHIDRSQDYIFGYAVSCSTWKERVKYFQNAIQEINDNFKFSDKFKYYIALDASHGHTEIYKNTLQNLYEYCKENIYPSPKILSGTISTPQAVEYLYEYCNGTRCGIGSGSICSTRLKTAHGTPLFQSLIECADVCHDVGITCFADGGLRISADLVKSLAVSADCLDLGSLLATTSSSPAEKIYGKSEFDKCYEKELKNNPDYQLCVGDPLLLKNSDEPIIAVCYRGMASEEEQKNYSEKRKSGYYVEGISVDLPYTGKTEDVVNDLLRGIRSGFTYSGAHNIQELREKARFRMVTLGGLQEAQTHALNKI